MKKFLLTLAAVLTCSMSMWAESELTVCEGTETNGSVPINGLWTDSQGTTSQCIYASDMVTDMTGQEITAVKFYLSGNGIQFKNCTLTFSMGETEQTEYESPTAIEGLTTVKTWAIGTEYVGQTELLLEFDTPYHYNGGNLVFESKVTVSGGYGGTYFFGVTTEANVAFSRTSRTPFLPKTTFVYGEKADYEAKLSADALSFGKVSLMSEKTLTFTVKNNGKNAFTPAIGVLEAPFSSDYTPAELASGETAEIAVTYAPTGPGYYSGILPVDCGQAGTFNVALNGYSLNEMELTVCDGTEQSAYFPTYGYYFDVTGTMSQMLYPADMLADAVGCQVTGVRFYPESKINFSNGDLKLSMGETDIVQYESAGVSSMPTNVVSDLAPVATTTIAGGEEVLEFAFTEPVTYEGGTLALQCEVSRAGSYATTYWMGVNAAEGVYMSYAKYSSSNISSRFMPKMTLLYVPKSAEETLTVTGIVTDTDQQPLEGVNVTLASNDRAQFTAVTDAEGAYSIEMTPVEGTTYNMTFEKEGYKTVTLEGVDLNDEINAVMEVDSATAITDIEAAEQGKVTYVNMMGQASNRPFQGVNIVVKDGKTIGKVVK